MINTGKLMVIQGIKFTFICVKGTVHRLPSILFWCGGALVDTHLQNTGCFKHVTKFI